MSRDGAKLSPKQERFVQEYLVDLNATQAAIRAGYSKKTAASIGEENLRKPGIQNFIAHSRAQVLAQTVSRTTLVLESLERILHANILDYMDLTDPKRPVFDLGRITRDRGAVIQEVAFHPRTGRIQIKLYDKIAAAAHLGKFEGLSKERYEHTGPDGGPLRLEVVFVAPPKRQSAAGREGATLEIGH